MSLNIQASLILLAGATILYLLFATGVLFDRYRMLALPPPRRLEAVPYRAIVLGAIGLACVTFSTEFLIFGTRPLPYPLRATPVLLWVVVLGSAAVKRVRSR